MTDKEIIKALERIIQYSGFTTDDVSNTLLSFFDLINRQQIVSEKLQKNQDDIDNFARDICKERLLKGKAIANFDDLQEYIRKEKSKAVKEFAKRLKEEWFNNRYDSPDIDFDYFIDIMIKKYEKGR